MFQTQQSYLKSKLDLSIYCVGGQRIKYDSSKSIKKKRSPGIISHEYDHISKDLTAEEIRDSPY